MPHKILPRKTRERHRRRREILDAARDLFCARGYADVSIREIAAEAECAIGTLYKFFGGKEALYAALVEEFFAGAAEDLAAALAAEAEPVARLRGWIRAKDRIFRENDPLLRLVAGETGVGGANAGADLGPRIRERKRALVDELAGVFAAGIVQGRFAPVAAPRLLAVALDSLTTALLVERLETGAAGEPAPPLDPDAILQVLFAGLLVA